jgi:hypothetical protein
MRALLIKPDEAPEVVEQNGLDDLQGLVGGWIEGLNVNLPNCYAFGNDEAKIITVECRTCDGYGCLDCGGRGYDEGMPMNVLASALVYGDPVDARRREAQAMDEWRAAGFEVIEAHPLVEREDGSIGKDPREPFISGPIVVTGTNNQGDTLPIPDDALTIINAITAQLQKKVAV